MGCGCGKRTKTAGRVFRLTMPDGTTSDHQSRIEAEAQNIRLGGRGKIRVLSA